MTLLIGYGLLFNRVDFNNDIFTPDCKIELIEKVYLLLEHDYSRRLGYLLDVKRDEIGLVITSKITSKIHVELDYVKQMSYSIGYSHSYRIEEESNVWINGVCARRIDSIIIEELSLVRKPMNEAIGKVMVF